MLKRFLFLITSGGLLVMALALIANIFALDPSLLSNPLASKKNSSIPVQLPPTSQPPPELKKTPSPNSSQDLAPTLQAENFVSLGGMAFSGQNSGSGLAGGGGFGSDPHQIMKNENAPDRPPQASFKNPPEYPQEARSRGITGFVTLKIKVSENGAIEVVNVEDSQPKGYFDQVALKAIHAWKFTPAQVGGKFVSAWITQKFKFELD